MMLRDAECIGRCQVLHDMRLSVAYS
jgi:hypothetical protein